MNVPSKTFMLVMSHQDFHENTIDKIYSPYCKNGYVYILKGDETPEIFNEKLAKAEKELEYWKKLAAHRLKGLLYWRHIGDKYLRERTLNELFKDMFNTKNVLLDKVKKSYDFYGSKMNVPFGTRIIEKKEIK